jgi:hypothetical protein
MSGMDDFSPVETKAYHTAFLAVERQISNEYILSYYERFRFLSVSTPEEKAEWINAFSWSLDSEVTKHRTRKFLEVMKDLLIFHNLLLKFDFDIGIYTCENDTFNK